MGTFLAESSPPKCYSKPHNLLFSPLFISLAFLLLFLLLATSSTVEAAPAALITPENFLTYYTKQCSKVVPESPATGTQMDSDLGQDRILHFDMAYFTGGHQILPKQPAGADSDTIAISFHPKRNRIFFTLDPHVVMLHATLKFRLPFNFNVTWHRNLRQIHLRAPKIPIRRRSLGFELYGFWSMNSGKLCMVGSGSSSTTLGIVSSLNVVLRLNYPVNLVNVSSLINGILESLDNKASFSYFDPVSILGIPHYGQYNYTLMVRGYNNGCFDENDDSNENLQLQLLEPGSCLTQLNKIARSFELEYESECSSKGGSKCNPLGEGFSSSPKYMTIQAVRCENGHAIRVLIGFSSSVFGGSGPLFYNKVFDPNRMLIGEGSWDEKKGRLCVVACRVLGFRDLLANASVGDCSMRLSLRFPRTLTIKHRSSVLGQIWSKKTVNDAGYFNRIGFHGSDNKVRGLPGLKYEYTVLDKVSKSCAKNNAVKGKGKAYPNGFSFDMKFYMSVRNGEGQTASGFSTPFFVENQLYEPYQMNNNQSGILKISYKIRVTATSNFQLGNKILANESIQISAEGIYDNRTGILCMIGCRHKISHIEKSINNDSLDCEILVNVQFSPLDSKGWGNIKGTIESMRKSSDPLYFGQLEISSNLIYTSQAADSIWRMDMETTMVLISNTLACVLVGLQLYHVKKHPDILPSISLLMILVLTLGYMIPLMLNFEALFRANHNRQDIFLESGGWLEVNEVIVRVVTMVAFLLQFRLLQLAWFARQRDENHKRLWLSEIKVISLSLPSYIAGALMFWYVHQHKHSYRALYLRQRSSYQQHYLWEDLKSYAGLILDGFLFPQIVFNFILNSKENILSTSFYVGTTIVRILPHSYDLYRAHSSDWYPDFSYIYANHRQDLYSTAWDIVIPFGGLLFATVIYLQQQFGGRCILPKRFREIYVYEKLRIAGSEEMHGEISL